MGFTTREKKKRLRYKNAGKCRTASYRYRIREYHELGKFGPTLSVVEGVEGGIPEKGFMADLRRKAGEISKLQRIWAWVKRLFGIRK